MKLRVIIASGLLLALLGCSRPPAPPNPSTKQTFDVRGIVREVDPKDLTITIEHENIPGYMEAMTMPFPVKDPELLNGLTAGDRVKFHLLVTKDDSWIALIEKIGRDTNAVPTTAAQLPTEREPLAIGEEVPDFALVDQDGKTIHLRDFREHPVMLTFIFTRCPLPNYCPLMTRNFGSLQAELVKSLGDKFHLITISFDPDHDTPAVLKEYATSFEANLKSWSFATGTPTEIRAIGDLFGLTYETENGSITHNMRTALIDPHGRLVHVWKSNVWTPEEVEHMVQEILPPRGS